MFIHFDGFGTSSPPSCGNGGFVKIGIGVGGSYQGIYLLSPWTINKAKYRIYEDDRVVVVSDYEKNKVPCPNSVSVVCVRVCCVRECLQKKGSEIFYYLALFPHLFPLCC